MVRRHFATKEDLVLTEDGEQILRAGLDLITLVPALRATMLQRAFDAQQQLAAALRQTCTDELDDIDIATRQRE